MSSAGLLVLSPQRWSAVYILTHPSFSCSCCLPQTPQKMRVQSHQVCIIIIANSSEPFCAKIEGGDVCGYNRVFRRWRWKDCLFKALLNCLRPCPKNKQKELKGYNGKCTFMPICNFLWPPPVPVKPQCAGAAWPALRKQCSCLVHASAPLDGQCGQCGRVSWKWSLFTVVSAVCFWWSCEPRASGMPIITSFTELHPIALGSYTLSRLPASGLPVLLGHCGNKHTVPSVADIFLLSVERVEHSAPVLSLGPQGSCCQCNLPVT